MLLFEQVEQLQQAVFHCAVGFSPIAPSTSAAPIRVFSVEYCTAGNVPAERSVSDPAAMFHTLHGEQERRKRVLGWRHTQKGLFAGEREQITA
jgi:hypothetical protein